MLKFPGSSNASTHHLTRTPTEPCTELLTRLDERSRCFLVKQGHASALCRLDLQGLDDALAVLSANTGNIQLLQQGCFNIPRGQRQSLRRKGWLQMAHICLAAGKEQKPCRVIISLRRMQKYVYHFAKACGA